MAEGTFPKPEYILASGHASGNRTAPDVARVQYGSFVLALLVLVQGDFIQSFKGAEQGWKTGGCYCYTSFRIGGWTHTGKAGVLGVLGRCATVHATTLICRRLILCMGHNWLRIRPFAISGRHPV